jgi:hypothetical protein
MQPETFKPNYNVQCYGAFVLFWSKCSEISFIHKNCHVSAFSDRAALKKFYFDVNVQKKTVTSSSFKNINKGL